MQDLINKLSVLLSDIYVLYLKTQNYHWHVTGPNFKSIHELLEQQYLQLADSIDEIAELIRIKGHYAPATFQEFLSLKKLDEGNSKQSSAKMLTELADNHQTIIDDIMAAINISESHHEEGISNVLSERISAHEKMRWILKSSI